MTDPYAAQRGGQIPPDVDVTYLVAPDPTIGHDVSETDVEVIVTNWDDVEHEIKIVLQVYEEVDYDPFVIWSDDVEDCYEGWWTEDHDDDGDYNTWARTDTRSYSGDYSWHNTEGCQPTYYGNQDDWLITEINIAELMEGKCDGNYQIFVDWMQWVQGELSEDQGKYEDYGSFWYGYSDDPATWIHLADYEDSGGAWLTSDPDNKSIEARAYPWADYEYDANGDPIGYQIPFNPATDETIYLAFQWTSDPCTHYEGWYIDDITVKAQCGSDQMLVFQGYKPVDTSFTIPPFDNTYEVSEENYYRAPFQQYFQFALPFTPKDDTNYFFEAYSEILDVEDTDGHWDFEGDDETTYSPETMTPSRIITPDPLEFEDGWFYDCMKTDTEYWNPKNGVNESVYFGDWHDGAAEYVRFEGIGQEIELDAGNCIDIPITGQVSNQGTITEPIPYTIEVKKTIVDFFFADDIEKGDTDYYTDPANWDDNPWQIGYFDNPDAVNWRVSDFKASSPENAWYTGVPISETEGFYSGNQFNALATPWVDISEYLAQDMDIGFTVDMTWSFDPTLNPGHLGHYGDHGDAVIFGATDPINNLWLFFTGTEIYGADPVGGFATYTVEDIYGNRTFPAEDMPAEGYDVIYTWGGEPIDTVNDLYYNYANFMISHGYQDPQGRIAIFVGLQTDASGIGYPGRSWGGIVLDNFEMFVSSTGETVWSMDGVTEELEPGELSEVIEAYWPACNHCDYTPVLTTHLEDDWNTPLRGDSELGYMYNDEAVGDNVYIRSNLYQDDFEGGGAFTDVGEFSPEWTTHD
ncbi:MAG: hypothetical protein ACP5FL_08135, partial [Thermoplasmatota archaeon]